LEVLFSNRSYKVKLQRRTLSRKKI
jgi:hypothetical protein